jgi:hypothetical protein
MGWVKGEAEHLMQDRKIGEVSGIPSAARARGVIAATIRGRILTGCCRIAPLPSPAMVDSCLIGTREVRNRLGRRLSGMKPGESKGAGDGSLWQMLRHPCVLINGNATDVSVNLKGNLNVHVTAEATFDPRDVLRTVVRNRGFHLNRRGAKLLEPNSACLGR